MLPVEQPFKTYTDLDGKPLDDGYVYFGQPNQEPRTHPVTVYWDATGTIPAAQPLRTVNGYIMRGGTPANVFFDGAYSELVLDSKKRQVFYARTSDGFSIGTLVEGLFKASGSGKVGFIQDDANAVQRSVEDELRERVSVTQFGADPTNAEDSTAAIQAAIDHLGSRGGVVAVPAGTYRCTGELIMRPRVVLQGDGRQVSKLQFTHTGDGIRMISPINSSTGVYIGLRDIGLVNTNSANAGGGFVEVGGTFVDLLGVYFSGFRNGIIFDQSEVVTVDQCDFLVSKNGNGIWIVNGDDYTLGAKTGFTNRLAITRSNFNGPADNNYAILDEGGVNHTISDNNFNGCMVATWAAAVGGLNYEGNEVEGQLRIPLRLMDTKVSSGEFIGPSYSIHVNANTFAPDIAGAGYAIELYAALGGEIENNAFANSSGIILSGNPHRAAGVEIGGNQMSNYTNFGTGAVIDSATSQALAQHIINQVATTGHEAPIGAGTRVCTPYSMFGIAVGKQLLCASRDGTNAELVVITDVGAKTFTATFALSKNSGFVITGVAPMRESSGIWVPVLAGTDTPGVHGYSEQKGFWSRLGNRVRISASIAVADKDAAMVGGLQVLGLPFSAGQAYGSAVVPVALFDGFTLSGGRTALTGIVFPNTSAVALRKAGSGVALTIVPQSDIPGAICLLSFSAEYYTDAP